LLRAGRDREALAEFRRALSLDIDDGEVHRDAELCVRKLFPERAVARPESPLWPLPPAEQEFAELFNMLFYSLASRLRRTFTLDWLGHECQKTPGDMWAYQEIIFATKPDVIVECGTYKGASALYFASLLQLIGKGEVVSIDINARTGRPEHGRIHYITGSSVVPDVVERVRRRVSEKGKVMVVLDSDHSRDHVLAELRAYGPLVGKDCYLVVEDGNVNFRPVHSFFYPSEGPTEAIMEFLKENDAFHIDKTRERFLVSVCPNGFLRRI
jgi:cephalosporin hydroxylase